MSENTKAGNKPEPGSMREKAEQVLAEKARKAAAAAKGTAETTEGTAEEGQAMRWAAEAIADETQSQDAKIGLSLQNVLFNGSFEPVEGYVSERCMRKKRGEVALEMGRIKGRVTGIETIETQYGQRMAVLGNFIAAATLRGDELLTGDRLFLSPQSFAKTMAAMLAAGLSSIEVDVDVGAVSTGKGLGYAWTCTLYVDESSGGGRALAGLLAPRRLAAKRQAAIAGPEPFTNGNGEKVVYDGRGRPHKAPEGEAA